MFQDDDSAVLVRLIAEFIHRRKSRAELVLRVPILQFPECHMRGPAQRKPGRSNLPLHFTNPLRRLFPIYYLSLSSMFARALLLFMPKLGFLHPHPRGRITQPEFGVVHQVERKRDGILLKEDNESVSAEGPIVSSVHLHFWFALIVLFHDTAFTKPLEELIELRVSRQIRHVNRSVFRFVRL